MDDICKEEKRKEIMIVRRIKVYKYTDEEEKEYKDRMDRDMDLPISEMKDKVATRILLKGMVEAYGEIMSKIRHKQAEAVKNYDISLLDYKNYIQNRKSAESQR
jgi:hypothetical protein